MKERRRRVERVKKDEEKEEKHSLRPGKKHFLGPVHAKKLLRQNYNF